MKGSNAALAGTTRRLHPVSLLFFAEKTAKSMAHALPLIPLIGVLVSIAFGERVNGWTLAIVMISVVFMLVLGLGWLRWYRFTYVVKNGKLYIEQGIWFRKQSWISKEKVMSVELTVSLYQRPFGLTSLLIGIAGAEEAVVELSCMSKAEAERIRKEMTGSLLSRKEAEGGELKRISLHFNDLLSYSITSARIGIALAVLGAIVARFDDFKAVFDLWAFIAEAFGSYWYIKFPILIMAAAWFSAVILTILMDYHFRLERDGDQLLIKRGLLQKKASVIPLRRIQAVKVVENPLRRPFGLVTVYAVIAGKTNEDTRTVVLFPLLKAARLNGFLKSYVPGFEWPEKWSGGPTPFARSHFLLLPVLLASFIAIPGLIWLPGYYAGCALLLPMIAALWGELRYKQSAWSVEGTQLAILYGGISRRQVCIPKNRMQWCSLSQTAWQERRGCATLRVAVAAGSDPAIFAIRHSPQVKLGEMLEFLSK
ncbi:PH domain-containing protein [Paenibacillus sp. GCM10027627]|uniref:PH domain-containing protein n=1 Tax=unclassified Paenibacillus TaxID=185978 RepID=UPI00362C8E14